MRLAQIALQLGQKLQQIKPILPHQVQVQLLPPQVQVHLVRLHQLVQHLQVRLALIVQQQKQQMQQRQQARVHLLQIALRL